MLLSPALVLLLRPFTAMVQWFLCVKSQLTHFSVCVCVCALVRACILSLALSRSLSLSPSVCVRARICRCTQSDKPSPRALSLFTKNVSTCAHTSFQSYVPCAQLACTPCLCMHARICSAIHSICFFLTHWPLLCAVVDEQAKREIKDVSTAPDPGFALRVVCH